MSADLKTEEDRALMLWYSAGFAEGGRLYIRGAQGLEEQPGGKSLKGAAARGPHLTPDQIFRRLMNLMIPNSQTRRRQI